MTYMSKYCLWRIEKSDGLSRGSVTQAKRLARLSKSKVHRPQQNKISICVPWGSSKPVPEVCKPLSGLFSLAPTWVSARR